MKKIISLAVALAMIISVVPMFGLTAGAAAEETTVPADRAMYFSDTTDLGTASGDDGAKNPAGDKVGMLVAAGKTWTAAKSFTDDDGTVTNQSSLSTTGNFNNPRHTVIAFKLPQDLDYSKLVSVTLAMTVTQVKQTSGGQRLGVYGNSIKDSWTVDANGKNALGADGDVSKYEFLGLTDAITAGSNSGYAVSGQTINLNSKKLLSYVKRIHEEGYDEVTFRIAGDTGGVWIYNAQQKEKPTLTLKVGEPVTVTVTTTLDGRKYGDDISFITEAGGSYTYPNPAGVIKDGEDFYVLDEENSVLTITPEVGGENMIELVYTKYDGTGLTGSIIADGATCWFADPRSLTVKNEDGTVNYTYIGYIDNYGNIKATQYDNNTKEYEEVLVRSNIQPDDHNNPSFLELPDHHIMIIYSRHTDEPCFYYRVSKEPYDITTLAAEKRLDTNHNTTYPNPFILSDDPDHFYMGWRGVGWHPTLAQLNMPTAENDYTASFSWGPKQIVQSSGSRPYAKYTSNGKDEIWVTYTTGHPDNENPDWLYFNRIKISNYDILDVNGNVVGNVDNNMLKVNKNDDTSKAVAVDTPSQGTRDWVWEVVNDGGHPAIAMVKLTNDRRKHDYWYARHDGTKWEFTDLPDPEFNTTFHENASNSVELCYSGGMSIDKADPHVIYASVPVDGVFGRIFEIVRYTLSDDYSAVTDTTYITKNSEKDNARPYIANGSEEGDLRLTWFNGDYYYWIHNAWNGGKGYPVQMMTITDMKPLPVKNGLGADDGKSYDVNTAAEIAAAPAKGSFTISLELNQNDIAKEGTLLESGNLKLELKKQTVDDTYEYKAVAPQITVGEKVEKSQNMFSDASWYFTDNGKNGSATWGVKGQASLGWINYVVTYDADARELVTYVNGLIDATIQDVDVTLGEKITAGPLDAKVTSVRTANTALTQAEIRAAVEPTEITVKHVNADGEEIAPSETFTALGTTYDASDYVIKTPFYGNKTIHTYNADATGALSGEIPEDKTVTIVYDEEPYDGLLLNLSFDDEDSGFAGGKGKAEAQGKNVLADGKQGRALSLDGTVSNWLNVTENGGGSLLTRVPEMTVSFYAKIADSSKANWPFFAASDTSEQHYESEHYLGGLIDKDDVLTVERYSGGERAANPSVTGFGKDWKLVTAVVKTGSTELYIDGKLAKTQDYTNDIFATLGSAPILQIGKANWGKNGEFYNGLIDEFRIYDYAMTDSEVLALAGITEVTAEPALRIVEADGTATLGLAFTATVKGVKDGITDVGFEYSVNGKDESGNYTVAPESMTDKAFGKVSDTFRLAISGITATNSARTYNVRPYVVIGEQKIYGETVSASLYGELVDSIINGKGTTIRPARLTAANAVISFVKQKKSDTSEAKFPLLKGAWDKLYGADGMVKKAVDLGIKDDVDVTDLQMAETLSLESVEIEFVETDIADSEIVDDLTDYEFIPEL